MSDETILCARCSNVVDPASENIWQMKFVAFAGPFDLTLPGNQTIDDIRREIEELHRLLEDVSEREALEAVRSFGLYYFCDRCYREWREDPAGSEYLA